MKQLKMWQQRKKSESGKKRIREKRIKQEREEEMKKK
jgi:hypothetical protein